MENGRCERCPDFSKPGGSLDTLSNKYFTECVSETCTEGHVNTLNGGCRACPSGTIPDSEGHKCQLGYCASIGEGHKVLIDGECVDRGNANDLFEFDELDIELAEFADIVF